MTHDARDADAEAAEGEDADEFADLRATEEDESIDFGRGLHVRAERIGRRRRPMVEATGSRVVSARNEQELTCRTRGGTYPRGPLDAGPLQPRQVAPPRSVFCSRCRGWYGDSDRGSTAGGCASNSRTSYTIA